MARLLSLLILIALFGQPKSAMESQATAAFLLPTPWPIAARSDALRMRVAVPGLVQVTQAQLQAAGWSAVDPTMIALWYHGIEQPLTIQSNGDLAWIARPTRSRYHADAVYWLTHESRPGLRGDLAFAPGLPLTWEDDALYDQVVAAPNGDHWFAGSVTAADPTRQILTATLTLPTAIPAGTPLRLEMATAAVGSHLLQLTANTQALPLLSWSGQGAQVITATLPALPAGPLTIPLHARSLAPILIDQVSLPTIAPAIAAPPQTPTIERGSGVDLSHGPTASQTGVQDLVITVPSLAESLAPLVVAHQELGRSVAVMDVQAAYDAFAFGERDPEAIRQLAQISQTWNPPIQSVLLAGSGSVRMRVAAGETDPTLIPPYLLWLDSTQGEIACDTCYVRLTTGPVRSQAVPDLAIGRLPVQTPAEASVVVAKTVTALTKRPGGAWRWQALLMSDNDRQADGMPDPAGPFTATVNRVAAQIPPGIGQTRLMYDPTGQVGESDVAKLRCQMFRALDGGAATDPACPLRQGESGVSLWVYVGHGSPWQWAATAPDAAVPYLWYLYDADARTNGDRLPILLSLTCLTGNWANPFLQTTDERLLLHAGGGTVASLSATGLGVNTTHAQFAAALLPALEHGMPLGMAQRVGVAALPPGDDLTYTFGILGDPLVTLPSPPTAVQWFPLEVR